MKHTPGSVEGIHVLLTGPITGNVQLADGSTVDVSATFIEVTDDTAAEIANAIAERYAAEGHPDDVERDDETGEMVQREFVHDSKLSAKNLAALSSDSKKD